MKKKGHPKYQEVLFVDSSTGHKFVCGTTLQPKETEKFEGKEYPVYRVAISSASHPFFTGSKQFIDTEGRVDKFTKRYEKLKQQKMKEKEKENEKQKKPVAKKKSSAKVGSVKASSVKKATKAKVTEKKASVKTAKVSVKKEDKPVEKKAVKKATKTKKTEK